MDINQQEWADKAFTDPNAVILDVRTPQECALGIIKNAITIDIYKGQGFIDAIQELDKTKNYYVYCKSGGRSAQACDLMHALGFATAYNLIGGITNWSGEIEKK